jgi:hypothetical protein
MIQWIDCHLNYSLDVYYARSGLESHILTQSGCCCLLHASQLSHVLENARMNWTFRCLSRFVRFQWSGCTGCWYFYWCIRCIRYDMNSFQWQFEYTTAVINEALRLYPPAHVTARSAVENLQLGQYHVPKGTHPWTFWGPFFLLQIVMNASKNDLFMTMIQALPSSSL